MKKRTARIPSVLLSLTLVLSLAACAGDSQTPASSSSAQESESTEASTPESASSPEEQPAASGDEVTLRIYAPVGGETPLTAGLQDDPVAEKIRQDTGVIIDIELVDANKTQAMVASGDMFDLNVIDKVDYIDPLIKVGAIGSFEPYLDAAPELTGGFGGLIDFSRDYMSAGTGELYVLPARAKTDPTPVYPSQDGNFIRWDYYEEIGMPELNSMDDLVDAIAQIVENHPTTEDGKQVFGTATFIDWNLTGYRGTALKKYYGNTTIGPFDSYSLVDMSYRDLYDDYNDLWLSSMYYNKMNQRGLLDPESFTQKFENVVQKIAEGRIMTMQAEWYMQTINQELNSTTDGKAKYVDIPFADTAEFPAWYDRSAPFGYVARMFVMGANTEHPEKVMELVNWLYSVEGSRTMFNGVRGQTWEEVDGKAAMLPEAMSSIMSDPSYNAQMGINKYKSIVGQDYDAVDQSTGIYVDLMQEREVIKATMNDADKAYCEHYGAEIPLDVIGNRQNKTGSNLAYEGLMPTNIPTEISRAVTKIENYLMQEIPNLIQSPDDAAFQEKLASMREELKNMEYDTVRDFYKTAFEEAVVKYEEYNK